MSTCEKCWVDAHRLVRAGEVETEADGYARLMKERAENACTAEEQAGPDATECDFCKRRTRHQITGECMACGNDECDCVPHERQCARHAGTPNSTEGAARRQAREE